MKSIVTAIALALFTLSVVPSLQAKSADEGKAAVKQQAPKVFTSAQKEGTKATCPVMGDEFVIGKDTLHSEYKGKHVYFCCPGCKKNFDKDPEKYLK
jgi:YHS domain-containing protein